MPYFYKSVSKLRNNDQEFIEEYRKINPQKLVPTLIDGEVVITQSLAILEYLEERYPQPSLLPIDIMGRAYVRQISLLIACDIHPLSIMRVRRYFTSKIGLNFSQKMSWYRHWASEGLQALEELLSNSKLRGSFCYGDEPTIADAFLVPQFYNAERFQCPLEPYPVIRKIHEVCMRHPAFIAAQPHLQPDASEYSSNDEY